MSRVDVRLIEDYDFDMAGTEDRTNISLVVAARTREQLAIELLTSARAEVGTVVGVEHPAYEALSRALLEVRRAAEHTQLVLRRIP